MPVFKLLDVYHLVNYFECNDIFCRNFKTRVNILKSSNKVFFLSKF